MDARLLIVDIDNLDMINDSSLDGFVLPVKGFASYANHLFSLDEIKKAVELKKDKLIIVKLDKIIGENDLEGLKELLTSLVSLNVDYYIFSDFAVANLLKGKVGNEKLIYANSKMLASSKECEFYSNLGYNYIPSTELNITELKNVSGSNAILSCFGYLNIFYSKRPLLTLFENHQRKIFRRKLKNKVLFIREEKRDALNPIYENENGTFIFSDFVYSLYKEINNLNPKMFYINSMFFDSNDISIVASIFKKAISGNINIKDYEYLVNNYDIGSGFLYLDSLILDDGVK